MKGFFSKKTYISCLIFVSGIAALLHSCTSVNDSLGWGLIPKDQETIVNSDVFGIDPAQRIKTYNIVPDSVFSINSGVGLMGKSTEVDFGKTSTASLMQFLPVTKDPQNLLGTTNDVDSVKLFLYLTYLKGDSVKLKEQTFNIYQLIGDIDKTDKYYTNFDYSEICDPDPLFSFKFSGKPKGADSIKLEPENITAKGHEFINSLLSNAEVYKDDNKFQETFKGFLMKTDDASPDDAAIYTNLLSSSYFQVAFSNNRSGKDESNKIDYSFSDSQSSNLTVTNTSIAIIERDYTGSFLEGEISSDVVANVGYVEALAGITTALEFPDEFFDAINAKKNDDQDIMINQALMYIYLDADTNENLDQAPLRIGSYSNYSTLTNIPDYAYAFESSVTVPYGGNLNRTHGYYSMDISSYIQHGLKKRESEEQEDTRYRITLAPAYNAMCENKYVALAGYTDNPTLTEAEAKKLIRVKITYTLINKK